MSKNPWNKTVRTSGSGPADFDKAAHRKRRDELANNALRRRTNPGVKVSADLRTAGNPIITVNRHSLTRQSLDRHDVVTSRGRSPDRLAVRGGSGVRDSSPAPSESSAVSEVSVAQRLRPDRDKKILELKKAVSKLFPSADGVGNPAFPVGTDNIKSARGDICSFKYDESGINIVFNNHESGEMFSPHTKNILEERILNRLSYAIPGLKFTPVETAPDKTPNSSAVRYSVSGLDLQSIKRFNNCNGDVLFFAEFLQSMILEAAKGNSRYKNKVHIDENGKINIDTESFKNKDAKWLIDNVFTKTFLDDVNKRLLNEHYKDISELDEEHDPLKIQDSHLKSRGKLGSEDGHQLKRFEFTAHDYRKIFRNFRDVDMFVDAFCQCPDFDQNSKIISQLLSVKKLDKLFDVLGKDKNGKKSGISKLSKDELMRCQDIVWREWNKSDKYGKKIYDAYSKLENDYLRDSEHQIKEGGDLGIKDLKYKRDRDGYIEVKNINSNNLAFGDATVGGKSFESQVLYDYNKSRANPFENSQENNIVNSQSARLNYLFQMYLREHLGRVGVKRVLPDAPTKLRPTNIGRGARSFPALSQPVFDTPVKEASDAARRREEELKGRIAELERSLEDAQEKARRAGEANRRAKLADSAKQLAESEKKDEAAARKRAEEDMRSTLEKMEALKLQMRDLQTELQVSKAEIEKMREENMIATANGDTQTDEVKMMGRGTQAVVGVSEKSGVTNLTMTRIAELEALEKQLDAEKARSAELEERLRVNDEEVGVLRLQVNQLTANLQAAEERYKVSLEEKDQRIAEVQDGATGLQESLNSSDSDKDGEISRLVAALEEANANAEAAITKAEDAEVLLKQREADLARANARIAELEKENGHLRKENADLQNQLGQEGGKVPVVRTETGSISPLVLSEIDANKGVSRREVVKKKIQLELAEKGTSHDEIMEYSKTDGFECEVGEYGQVVIDEYSLGRDDDNDGLSGFPNFKLLGLKSTEIGDDRLPEGQAYFSQFGGLHFRDINFGRINLFESSFRNCVLENVDFSCMDPVSFDTIKFQDCKMINCMIPVHSEMKVGGEGVVVGSVIAEDDHKYKTLTVNDVGKLKEGNLVEWNLHSKGDNGKIDPTRAMERILGNGFKPEITQRANPDVVTRNKEAIRVLAEKKMSEYKIS